MWASTGNADSPSTAGGLMAATKNTPKDYSNKNIILKCMLEVQGFFFNVVVNNKPLSPFGI